MRGGLWSSVISAPNSTLPGRETHIQALYLGQGTPSPWTVGLSDLHMHAGH